MPRPLLTVLFFVLGTMPLSRVSAPKVTVPPDTVVAFRDVSVLPMDSERVLAHQTVILRGDRIVAVGPVDSIAVPAGSAVVEAAGKFLIPGLADMHVHMPGDTSAVATENALTLFVAGGVTTIRVMSGAYRHLAIRDSVARGRVLGPSMYVAGAAVGALPDNTADLRRVLNAQEVRRLAERMKRAGFDFIQVTGSVMRTEYEELAGAARRAGIPLTGGVPVDVGLQRVIQARQASIENLDGYLDPLERDDSPLRYADPVTRARQLQHYYDEAKIPRLAASIRDAGVANTPTLFINHVSYTRQPAESLAAWPEMRFVTPRVLEGWMRQKRRAQELQAQANDGPQVLAFRNQLTKGLRDAGALILVGSDAPGAFLVPGFSTVYEIHSLTVAGLSRYEALRAATRSAAEFVHREGEFGTIAPGLRADLVLLDGNPLEDIGNLTLRSGVMLRGRWIPAEEINEMLERIAAAYRPNP
ncbi:MAG: amidohydrolase family protein [Gemmatimonadetes bacterium]|nr:amidohydrolase family protein [Gemmatimonadota bacterium]